MTLSLVLVSSSVVLLCRPRTCPQIDGDFCGVTGIVEGKQISLSVVIYVFDLNATTEIYSTEEIVNFPNGVNSENNTCDNVTIATGQLIRIVIVE